MTTVSMFEAKTNLSKYVNSVATKQEPFIIIVRNGTPLAKLVPYEAETGKRIGVAKNQLPLLESLDAFNSIDVSSDFTHNGGLL